MGHAGFFYKIQRFLQAFFCLAGDAEHNIKRNVIYSAFSEKVNNLHNSRFVRCPAKKPSLLLNAGLHTQRYSVYTRFFQVWQNPLDIGVGVAFNGYFCIFIGEKLLPCGGDYSEKRFARKHRRGSAAKIQRICLEAVGDKSGNTSFASYFVNKGVNILGFFLVALWVRVKIAIRTFRFAERNVNINARQNTTPFIKYGDIILFLFAFFNSLLNTSQNIFVGATALVLAPV